MELYHLHTKGIKDKNWKAKKEIIIDDNFSNRLSKIVNNFSVEADSSKLEDLASINNQVLTSYGYNAQTSHNLGDLLSIYNSMSSYDPYLSKYIKELLVQSANLLTKTATFKREMAMEAYRKDHKPNLPSRMHCLYALEEKDIDFWINSLRDGDLELFRIDVLDEAFKTSEQLIPVEHLAYKDFYDASYGYWNPTSKLIGDSQCEYLVKGKVKVLEKVAEIKKQ